MLHQKRFTRIAAAWLVFAVVLVCIVRAEEPSAFKFVLLPDTQGYAMHHPDTFYIQTKWIADNAEQFAFILHLGDITNNNTEGQWNVAEFSMRLLDDKVPYVLAMGNHDYSTNGSCRDRDLTLANKWFPYEKYSKTKGFGGAFESGRIENTWFTYKAGGVDWLVLSLEFGPRNRILDWADEIVKKHPKHRVIVITHGYMYADGLRLGENPEHRHRPQAYGLGKAEGAEAVNDGEMMWHKFVSKHANMMFVFSGHIAYNEGTRLKVDTGEHGNKVYQILCDFQSRPKGGEGYLSVVEVDTKKKSVDVKSYSPLLKKYISEPEKIYPIENVDFGQLP